MNERLLATLEKSGSVILGPSQKTAPVFQPGGAMIKITWGRNLPTFHNVFCLLLRKDLSTTISF
jgi:hypothetical protein